MPDYTHTKPIASTIQPEPHEFPNCVAYRRMVPVEVGLLRKIDM